MDAEPQSMEPGRSVERLRHALLTLDRFERDRVADLLLDLQLPSVGEFLFSRSDTEMSIEEYGAGWEIVWRVAPWVLDVPDPNPFFPVIFERSHSLDGSSAREYHKLVVVAAHIDLRLTTFFLHEYLGGAEIPSETKNLAEQFHLSGEEFIAEVFSRWLMKGSVDIAIYMVESAYLDSFKSEKAEAPNSERSTQTRAPRPLKERLRHTADVAAIAFSRMGRVSDARTLARAVGRRLPLFGLYLYLISVVFNWKRRAEWSSVARLKHSSWMGL